MAPPCEGDLTGLHLASDWQYRAVAHDIRKNILRDLEAFEPNVLILDFVNERFDLFRVGASVVTYSREFLSAAVRIFRGRDRVCVCRLSNEAAGLWADALTRLAAFLRRSASLEGTRVVLHRAP